MRLLLLIQRQWQMVQLRVPSVMAPKRWGSMPSDIMQLWKVMLFALVIWTLSHGPHEISQWSRITFSQSSIVSVHFFCATLLPPRIRM